MPRASRNPLAVAALVFGILSLCGGVLAPAGLALGYFALRRARRDAGAGLTQARVGIVLSLAGLAVTTPLLVILLNSSVLSGP